MRGSPSAVPARAPPRVDRFHSAKIDRPVERKPTRAAAVRAELLARLGRYAEAADAGELSLSGELSKPERDYRERRRTVWLAQAANGGAGG